MLAFLLMLLLLALCHECDADRLAPGDWDKVATGQTSNEVLEAHCFRQWVEQLINNGA